MVTPGGNIQAMAAGTQSGGGACLFTLDLVGALWFAAQNGAGGAWGAWQGPKFAGQPAAGEAITVAGQNNGRLMLLMTDETGMVWSMTQDNSGGWGNWQGPGIGGEEFSFGAIAAGEQSGARGIQLFAADPMGHLWNCYQMNPGADWSGWTSFNPGPAGEVALGGQNNGCLMLVTESEGDIAALPQTQPGGAWATEWEPLTDEGPSVNSICAAQQGGSRGIQIWGLDRSEAQLGQVWTVFQDTAGGNWDPWQGPGFSSQPEPFRDIAAAGQGNGCTILMGVDYAGNLWAIGQNSPGGGWGSWAQIAAPPS